MALTPEALKQRQIEIGKRGGQVLHLRKLETIRIYNLNPKLCEHCLAAIPYEKRKCRYCGHSCAGKVNGMGRRQHGNPPGTCLHCSQPKKNAKCVYCSGKCQQAHKYQEYIKDWQQGLKNGSDSLGGISSTVRRYIIEKYHDCCARCGWKEINPVTGKVPITIEHIDGNWRNNCEENLIALCPNCHSLTSTYGSLNKGRGRGMERYGPKFREFFSEYKKLSAS